jgi:O-antigen ligase
MTFTRRTFILVAIGAVLVGSVAWTVMPTQWKNANTFGYRLKYWQAAVEIWKNSPLIGVGFDGYRSMVYEAQAKINDRTKNFFVDYIDPKPRRVHNEYLQALVDGGILYAFVYFGFIAWVMAKSYGAARMNPTIRGIWCAQLSILTAASFFFTFRVVDTAMLFHINLGVLCATSQSSS